MAWISVLTIQNSTPFIALSIIRLTAFEPPPPIPITLILASFKLFKLDESVKLSVTFPLELSCLGLVTVEFASPLSIDISGCRFRNGSLL
ncbi:hypothetical protein CDL12_01571 [Handroanthus impetiginosus]|uniref:Uncharacterized protein n=1 Tax=Handroanthus impetiginosus TaxID=429701 RepID=A0A2G9I7G3_9LAMI|nr:hypothetical protein CDL12_01571 [Handroanthus impetiginosus]